MREIDLCNAVKLARIRYRSYGRLADAQFHLKWYDEALKTSDDCITVYYHSPECHYLRFMSLRMLGRIDDAWTEMLVTRSVSNQILNEAASPDAVVQNWLQLDKNIARRVLKNIADELESQGKDYGHELIEQRQAEREYECYVRECLYQCEVAKMSCDRTCVGSTGIDANAYEQCNRDCEYRKSSCQVRCR